MDFHKELTKIVEKNKIPSTIEVDGVKVPTTNSLGRPIANTIEDIKNFWKWFDDSELHYDLHPIVFHHSTHHDFKSFKIGSKGTNSTTFGNYETTRSAIFFSESIEDSNAYVTDKEGNVSTGAKTIPVYLKSLNSLNLTRGIAETIAEKLKNAGMSENFIYNHLGQWSNFDGEEGDNFVKIVKKAGYDSIIFNDENPNTGDGFVTVAVFSPNQVKSIWNKGKFDPQSTKISESIELRMDTDSHYKNQLDGNILAIEDEKLLGRLSFSEYNDVVSIKMIESFKKKEGIATKMFEFLLSKFPECKIDLGMMTEDGAKFFTDYFKKHPDKKDLLYQGEAKQIITKEDFFARMNEKYPKLQNVFNEYFEKGEVEDLDMEVLKEYGLTHTIHRQDQDSLTIDDLLSLIPFIKNQEDLPDWAINDAERAGIKISTAYDKKQVFEDDLSAWHGTGNPDPYDKFDYNKVGGPGGEGAQAYGWGLYFANSKEIGEYYKDKLGGATFSYDGKEFEKNSPKHISIELLWSWQGDKNGAIDDASGYENPNAIKSEIRKLDFKKIKKGGKLYNVDIPEDNEYLYWDGSIEEQNELVKKFFKNQIHGYKVQAAKSDKKWGDYSDPEQATSDKTGKDLYRDLSETLGSDKAASDALREAGVPGIRYLDGGSRADGEGTCNYVIFDDSRIKILAHESIEDDRVPETAEDFDLLQDLENKEKEAKAAGNMKLAFQYHRQIQKLNGDNLRAQKRKHFEENPKFAVFVNKEKTMMDIIHPDVKNKGKYRITHFQSYNKGKPWGHSENLTPEEAIAELSIYAKPLSTQDAKELMASWSVNEEIGNNFQNWFHGAGIVDDSGKPKIFYHGTNKKFDKFEIGRKSVRSVLFDEYEVTSSGIFFSESEKDAKSYGKYVNSFYLRSFKPFYIMETRPTKGMYDSQQIYKDLLYIFEPAMIVKNGEKFIEINNGLNQTEVDENGYWISKVFDNVEEGTSISTLVDWNLLDKPEIVNRLREKGYDSVEVEETKDSSGKSMFIMDLDNIWKIENIQENFSLDDEDEEEFEFPNGFIDRDGKAIKISSMHDTWCQNLGYKGYTDYVVKTGNIRWSECTNSIVIGQPPTPEQIEVLKKLAKASPPVKMGEPLEVEIWNNKGFVDLISTRPNSDIWLSKVLSAAKKKKTKDNPYGKVLEKLFDSEESALDFILERGIMNATTKPANGRWQISVSLDPLSPDNIRVIPISFDDAVAIGNKLNKKALKITKPHWLDAQWIRTEPSKASEDIKNNLKSSKRMLVIVLDNNNEIIHGKDLFDAAISLGMKKVPVQTVTFEKVLKESINDIDHWSSYAKDKTFATENSARNWLRIKTNDENLANHFPLHKVLDRWKIGPKKLIKAKLLKEDEITVTRSTFDDVSKSGLVSPGDIKKVDRPTWIPIEAITRSEEKSQKDKIYKIAHHISGKKVLKAIWIDEDNSIMDGHHRYEACKVLGFKKIPVQYVHLR